MAFDQNNRNDNEKKKFADDGSGNPAVRVKVTKTVISEGTTQQWYDHRGFLIMELDGDGNLAIAGDFIKLQ